MIRRHHLSSLAALALVAALILPTFAASPASALADSSDAAANTGSISGSVSLRNGDTVTPLHANINIHVPDPTSPEGWRWPGWNHWTAQDGTFTIDGLAARSYRLQFEATLSYALPEFWGGSRDVEGAVSIDVAEGEAVTGIDIVLDAYGQIYADLRFRGQESDESVPLEEVDVALWRLDEESGVYIAEHVSGPSHFQGDYYSPPLEPGTYSIRFRTQPMSGVGSEYYDNARYFHERTDIVVKPGDRIELGEVVLEPRYFDVGRIAGANRFETATDISRELVGSQANVPVLYITNGYKFPDALSAGPAAILSGGVILSVHQEYVPAEVEARIAEGLSADRVVILGDGNSISAAVEQRLRALLPSARFDRFSGADRYETGRMIVRDAFEATGSSVAFIATGANYPDALAAGPAAAANGAPVVLVNGAGRLDDGTRTLLHDLGVERVHVIGGEPSVSSALESDLRAEFGTDAVNRIAGANRFLTAVLINGTFLGDSDFSVLTTGYNFADALTGAPLAGALGAPLYLIPPECVPWEIAEGLLYKEVAGVIILGDRSSVGPAVDDLMICG